MSTGEPPHTFSFHEFEQRGWEAVSAEYDAAFHDLTTQSTEPLLDAAAVTSGVRVLDVATGPGYVAAAAAKRGARATGVDFSRAMIDRARGSYPAVEFREGDAQALPFDDESFDAVVMNFGLLHLAHPERALSEARRVLRDGGRVAFTVWAPPELAAAFAIVLRAIERHGRMDVPIPEGPPFFRFSDPDECRRGLVEAGLREPVVTMVPMTMRLRSPDGLFDMMSSGTVRTAALLRAQQPDALERIRSAMVEDVERHRAGDAFELPTPAVLASAVKPAAPPR